MAHPACQDPRRSSHYHRPGLQGRPPGSAPPCFRRTRGFTGVFRRRASQVSYMLGFAPSCPSPAEPSLATLPSVLVLAFLRALYTPTTTPPTTPAPCDTRPAPHHSNPTNSSLASSPFHPRRFATSALSFWSDRSRWDSGRPIASTHPCLRSSATIASDASDTDWGLFFGDRLQRHLVRFRGYHSFLCRSSLSLIFRRRSNPRQRHRGRRIVHTRRMSR